MIGFINGEWDWFSWDRDAKCTGYSGTNYSGEVNSSITPTPYIISKMSHNYVVHSYLYLCK